MFTISQGTASVDSMKLNQFLSFNAGYVDTASFLALHGLFAAHVTGNFVTLGAALISDQHAGTWIKVLALPVFVGTIVLTRIIDNYLHLRHRNGYVFCLGLMLVLLLLAIPLYWLYLPFFGQDNWISVILGMLLVMAMAIQNALHKLYWIQEAPSTVMTGSTTELSLSIGQWLYPATAQGTAADAKRRVSQQIKSILPKIIAFALGCAVAAMVYHMALKLLFILPAVLMVIIFFNRGQYKKG